ncbi:MAG: hypothetical protein ABW321_31360 [Polyangiales bacterium]
MSMPRSSNQNASVKEAVQRLFAMKLGALPVVDDHRASARVRVACRPAAGARAAGCADSVGNPTAERVVNAREIDVYAALSVPHTIID